jgi:hypothetical protein
MVGEPVAVVLGADSDLRPRYLFTTKDTKDTKETPKPTWCPLCPLWLL